MHGLGFASFALPATSVVSIIGCCYVIGSRCFLVVFVSLLYSIVLTIFSSQRYSVSGGFKFNYSSSACAICLIAMGAAAGSNGPGLTLGEHYCPFCWIE